MIYGQEPDSEISNKNKVVFNLPNYPIDTSNVTAKSVFIAPKAEVDKLDIKKEVCPPPLSPQKKEGGSIVQGLVVLKGGDVGRRGEGRLALFLFNFFKVYHFYI